jgi:serine/threonine protein kinase
MANISTFGIIHADIKPENMVVINTEMYPIDWGISQFQYGHGNRRKCTDIQTLWWRSPEVHCKKQDYTYKVDIWSLGVCLVDSYCKKGLSIFGAYKECNYANALVKMFTGREDEKDEINALKELARIVEDTDSYDDVIIKFISKTDLPVALIPLVTKMLRPNPSKRICYQTVLDDQAFSEVSRRERVKPWTLEGPDINTDGWVRAPELNLQVRSLLFNWLLEISWKFNFDITVLLYAYQLVDKIIELKDVLRENIQLIGCSCLDISSGLLSPIRVSSRCYRRCTSNSYTVAEIIKNVKMCSEILETGIQPVTPFTFYDRLSKLDKDAYCIIKHSCNTVILFIAMYIVNIDIYSNMENIGRAIADGGKVMYIEEVKEKMKNMPVEIRENDFFQDFLDTKQE